LYNKTIKKSRYHLGIKRSSEKLSKNNTWYRSYVDTSTGTFESGRWLPLARNLASRSPDKRLCQKNIFGFFFFIRGAPIRTSKTQNLLPAAVKSKLI
jgi:hypothetical protein